MLPPASLFLGLSLPPNRYSSHQHQQQPRLAALAPRRCLCCPLSGSFWQCCAVISHLVLHAATTPSSVPPSPVSRVPVTVLHARVSLSYTGVTGGRPSERCLSKSGAIQRIVPYNAVIKLRGLPFLCISNQVRIKKKRFATRQRASMQVAWEEQPWLQSAASRNRKIPPNYK